MITVVTPARSVLLTSLARFCSELGIDPDAAPSWLVDNLETASLAIADELDRPLTRTRIAERFGGTGNTIYCLTVTPAAALESLTHLELGSIDITVAGGAVRIADKGPGFLWRDGGWPDDGPWEVWLQPEQTAQTGREPWTATYLGGWLTHADDFSAEDAELDDDTITIPDGIVVPLLAAGDTIKLTGFDQAANNGRFVVLSIDGQEIQVDRALTTETADDAARIEVSNLPGQLERFTIDTLKAWRAAKTRDPNIQQENLADWGATYLTSAGNAVSGATKPSILPATVMSGLDRYRRLM